MKEIIALLNKMGHNIITREFVNKSSGQIVLYIVSIDGTRFTTAYQPEAHRMIKKLAGGIINGKEQNK